MFSEQPTYSLPTCSLLSNPSFTPSGFFKSCTTGHACPRGGGVCPASPTPERVGACLLFTSHSVGCVGNLLSSSKSTCILLVCVSVGCAGTLLSSSKSICTLLVCVIEGILSTSAPLPFLLKINYVRVTVNYTRAGWGVVWFGLGGGACLSLLSPPPPPDCQAGHFQDRAGPDHYWHHLAQLHNDTI